jgi:hypothetical protein
LALILCMTASAAAGPPPPEAKLHFDSGKDYYAHGKWEDASREFQRAYELAPLPDLLLNIARAETHLLHEEVAIGYLEKYVEARPDAEDAPSVRGEIAARRKALDDSKAALKAKEEAERARAEAQKATEAAKKSAEDARVARSEARPKWPGVTLLSIGAVIVGVGVLSGLAAVSASNTVSNGGTKDPKHPGVPSDWSTVSGANSSGPTAASEGVVLDIFGALFAGVGGGLLIWALTGPKAEKQVWIAPGPGGATVGGSF